ncbi:NAD(P)/FAD-dependent oxidoreductase, partial [Streptomyces toxytricini]
MATTADGPNDGDAAEVPSGATPVAGLQPAAAPDDTAPEPGAAAGQDPTPRAAALPAGDAATPAEAGPV